MTGFRHPCYIVIRNTRGRADTFTPKRMGMMARSIDDQEQGT